MRSLYDLNQPIEMQQHMNNSTTYTNLTRLAFINPFQERGKFHLYNKLELFLKYCDQRSNSKTLEIVLAYKYHG